MNNFKITKTILENINEQNDRINECVDIVNGYTTDEETRVNQEIQRQENELRREEQYNNNENRFNLINQQLDYIEQQTKEYKVFVENFNNIRVVDKVRNAINYAIENNIKEVVFACKDYVLEETLIIPSGIKVYGSGWERSSTTGTRILRSGNFNAIQVLPYLSDGNIRHSQGNEFHNICFYDYNSANVKDMVYCEKSSMMVFNNCQFRGCYGSQLVFAEVMDSRLYNCTFEECLGEVSFKMISNETSLITNYKLEFTNQIIVNDCRWEAYYNKAIKTEGSNTNEIYFNNCKLESSRSNDKHLILYKCSVVTLNGLQVYSKTTTDIDNIILIDNCYGVFGTLLLELHHDSNKLNEFLLLDNPNNIDLFVYLYNGRNLMSKVVNVQNNWANNSQIKGSVKGTTERIQLSTEVLEHISTNTIRFINGGSGNGYYLKAYNENGGTVIKLLKTTSSGEDVIFKIAETGVITLYNTLRPTKGMMIPNLETAPWSDNTNNCIYVDRNTNKLKVYLNGAYREIQTV